MPEATGPTYGETVKTKKSPAELYRRRKQREARRVKGANTRNWPTRPSKDGRVKKINAADLSPAERARRYGL
jgi:hypothetical protein